MDMVIAEGDGGHVERELPGVEVAAEVAGFDGHPRPFLGDEIETPLVSLLKEVALRSGTVIELDGGGDQQAPARHPGVVFPGEPVVEHRPDPGGSPRGAERAGRITISSNRSTVAWSTWSWSSSLDPKWAKRPLFDSPSSVEKDLLDRQ